MGRSTISMAIFHSDVSLPEGKYYNSWAGLEWAAFLQTWTLKTLRIIP